MTHVVVGIIIKPTDPKSYLLVSSNSDFGEFSGFYYPPSGHIEKGEDELSALKREIKEELTLEVTNATKLADTDGDIKNQKTSWYICDVENFNFKIDHQELKDAGFFTEREIKIMKIWPATKKVFDKYLF
ncbi:MAG: NUDIX hydrolase [Candidatus Buchananbacteria bacterium]